MWIFKFWKKWTKVLRAKFQISKENWLALTDVEGTVTGPLWKPTQAPMTCSVWHQMHLTNGGGGDNKIPNSTFELILKHSLLGVKSIYTIITDIHWVFTTSQALSMGSSLNSPD